MPTIEQQIEWMQSHVDTLNRLHDISGPNRHGLPELLESIGYADEEGMIEKALAAIRKAEGKE